MGLPPAGGRNGVGGIVGGGDPCLPPPEQSCTDYCNQVYSVSVSGGGEEARVKGDQAVARAGRIGCRGDVNNGSGGRTDVEGGGDGRDGDGYGYGYGLSWWDDNIANVTLGTEPNAPLDYDTGLEHHHPNISTRGEPGG